MGYKSKATKANKAKKVGKAPVKRIATGTTYTGVATHIPIQQWIPTNKASHNGMGSQGVMGANFNHINSKWTKGNTLDEAMELEVVRR